MVCDRVVRVSPAAATGRTPRPTIWSSYDGGEPRYVPLGAGDQETLSGEWRSFDWGMCWSNSGKRAVVGPGLGRCVIVMCIPGAAGATGAGGRRGKE